ncbi:hypothetical protein A9X05_09220 [Mycobacterium sp. E3298]|nr:hypothetical protein [Mycobacterium sp. E3298]OBG93870.1 hypothetical protein A9X05_09220 [Mycobacterium sp. E3298]
MERKDAWTEQDDSNLASTVLSHIKSGSTQLAAFEEASQIIGRTVSACGFRWNSELRKRYDDSLKEAKESRKQLSKEDRPQRTRRSVEQPEPIETIDMYMVFDNLQATLEAATVAIAQLKKGYEQLQKENERLNKRLMEVPSEDLTAILKLVEQARKLGVIKEGAAS